jgi:hypothetical protein
LVERERSLEESKEAIEAKLVEIYSEKDHVTFALDQTLKKLQVELEEISSVRMKFHFLLLILSFSSMLATVELDFLEYIFQLTSLQNFTLSLWEPHLVFLISTHFSKIVQIPVCPIISESFLCLIFVPLTIFLSFTAAQYHRDGLCSRGNERCSRQSEWYA